MARILVVDDNDDLRLALASLLADRGHTILEAADGVQVQRIALQDRPDLILLDVFMPRMDGFEALRLLKEDPQTREIPVIMVTVKGRPDNLQEARALGAADYINKPWARGEVEIRVGWVLEHQLRVAQ